MLLHSVRHDWPEKAGFIMSRPRGHTHYTFLHFSTSVHFSLNGEEIDARPGVCIFYAPGVPQSFRSSQDLIHNWLHAEPEFGELLKKYGIPENMLLYPGDTSFLSELFRRMEVEHFSESPYKEELLQGYLREFVIRFARAMEKSEPVVAVSRDMRDRLREKGILIRWFGLERIRDWSRITIGTREDMETLIRTLDQILEG